MFRIRCSSVHVYIYIYNALYDLGFLSRQNKNVFFSETSTATLRRTSLLFNRFCGSLQGLKRPGSHADHSSPSRDEVKNKWSHTLLSLYTLYSLRREIRCLQVLACRKIHIVLNWKEMLSSTIVSSTLQSHAGLRKEITGESYWGSSGNLLNVVAIYIVGRCSECENTALNNTCRLPVPPVRKLSNTLQPFHTTHRLCCLHSSVLPQHFCHTLGQPRGKHVLIYIVENTN